MKPNQRLEVLLRNRDGIVEHFRSRIEDINDDNISIAMPMSKGVPVMLGKGEMLHGRIVSDFAAYEFSSYLISRQFSPIPLWIISIPQSINKIQQRAFVRIEAALSVTITPIVDGKPDEKQKISVVTKDVSGGGVQIVTNRPWHIGTKFIVDINYPDFGPIIVKCEVIRVKQPQADKTVFWIGLKYLEISERDRGNIIKFIFKKQLDQRRKGY